MTIELLKTIETILALIITVGGVVFTVLIYQRGKRNDTIKKLASQIVAYNCLEQELVDELSTMKHVAPQTLKIDMRKKVLENNNLTIEAFMAPGKAKEYL